MQRLHYCQHHTHTNIHGNFDSNSNLNKQQRHPSPLFCMSHFILGNRSDIAVLAELKFLNNLNLKGNPICALPDYSSKVCVCMCLCVCASVCLSVCLCFWAQSPKHTHTHTSTRTHTHTHAHTRTHILLPDPWIHSLQPIHAVHPLPPSGS